LFKQCWLSGALRFDSLLTDIFDADTLLWTNIGIKVFGAVCAIFVNKEDGPTIEANIAFTFHKRAVYRFALK
jgi:hypothetical protein